MELEIKGLHVSVDGKEILKGVDLTVHSGEVHALMGPNGNGKSTLLAAVMGHPKYTIDAGEIRVDGTLINEMPVNERAKLGLFLAMQYPPDIPGVTNQEFFRASLAARNGRPMPLFQFIRSLDKATAALEMKADLAHRFVNEGFSGGEKKRNEIIQMMLLKPGLAMLDEIDSGLDVDAIKLVGDALNDMRKQDPALSLVVVSHYERFYKLVKPTHAHILVDGRIVVEGGPELTEKVDKEGYSWIEREYNVKVEDTTKKQPVSLGTCAVNTGGKEL